MPFSGCEGAKSPHPRMDQCGTVRFSGEGSLKAKWRVCGERGSAKIAVSASKIPSTKFCEGFWDFVAVSSPTGPPFHELSTNSLGFYECPAPSTMLVEQVFAKPFLCTTLPFASESCKELRELI